MVDEAAKQARRENMRRLARALPTAAFAAVLGGLLVGTALPRLVSSIALISRDGVIVRLERGKPVSTAELGAAETSRRRALAVLQSGRVWTELAAIYIERARRLAPSHRGHAVFLNRAIESLRRGLAIAPAQPVAWTMLARATLVRDGVAPSVAPALSMAIRTGPYHPGLLIPRLEIGLVNWSALDAETRDHVARQVLLAVDRAPVRLAALTRRRYTLRLVRDILAPDPTRLRRFDTVYLTAD